ncbi:hypothetical protein B0H13DRAFT_1873899 [Mycena leptocephala]|nr:hypothetical protein B0H13DRAFT_1873899 [Mycena leptocephala]
MNNSKDPELDEYQAFAVIAASNVLPSSSTIEDRMGEVSQNLGDLKETKFLGKKPSIESLLCKGYESRSVALLTPVLPLKQQQVQPREKVIRGLLRSRQDLSCDPGYGYLACCLIGEECCSGGGCCAIGYYCFVTGCCPDGETCGTHTQTTPIGAIVGGSVAGVLLLTRGIFIFFRHRCNCTQPLPACGTGIPLTPTPAEQKPGSAYSLSQVQAVTLPSSVGEMSQNPAECIHLTRWSTWPFVSHHHFAGSAPEPARTMFAAWGGLRGACTSHHHFVNGRYPIHQGLEQLMHKGP